MGLTIQRVHCSKSLTNVDNEQFEEFYVDFVSEEEAERFYKDTNNGLKTLVVEDAVFITANYIEPIEIED